MIDAILNYTVDGSEVFFVDGKTRDAVIRNIEIIGPAVKGVADDTGALRLQQVVSAALLGGRLHYANGLRASIVS